MYEIYLITGLSAGAKIIINDYSQMYKIQLITGA